MNTLTRFAIAALVIAASLQNVNAVQPRSLAERRAEMRTRILEAQAAKLAAFNQREKDFYSGNWREFVKCMHALRSSLTYALLSDKFIPYVLSHESDPSAAKSNSDLRRKGCEVTAPLQAKKNLAAACERAAKAAARQSEISSLTSHRPADAECQAETVSMGCCFSKEDDRFDANESLLPKGKQVDFDHVDLAKKAAGAGSYKSPELSLHQHRPNNHHNSHDHGHDNGRDHGHQRQQHAKEKKDATTTHQPAPIKAPAVVESVDLLGLTKPASPPAAAAPTLSADTPVFHPPHQAVPPPQVAAPVAPTRSVSPPKPPPTPAIAAQDAKPSTASTGKSTSPPKPTEKSASPPKPTEPKEPAKVDPPARTPSAPASAATTEDMDDEVNDDNSEKAPSLSASTSMKKTNKKKKKKGKK